MLVQRFALVALSGLCACEPGTFYTEVKGETTVAGDPTPISTVLGQFEPIGSFTSMDFNANQDFQNEGVTKDQVRSVKVVRFALTVLSPATEDFSFLDTVAFVAKVGDNEAVIAQKDGIAGLGLRPPNPVLELDVTDEELQPFVTAPAMNIVMRGTGRVPPQDITVEAAVKLRVELKLVEL